MASQFVSLVGVARDYLMLITEVDEEESPSSALEDYADLDLSDSDPERNNASRLYMHKFQNKVDFSMKSERQLKDKSDRATTDHALDRRSISILYKMMNQDIFNEVNGCISTGKEANIYHVKTSEGIDLALKVYMTSIMPFKSRDKYVKGDFRMRHGYSKATSWRLVSKWAEKEYRNLIRINQSGLILAPKPLKLKSVVLLMSFIGKDGTPAPKLKDAVFIHEDSNYAPPNWRQLYIQVVHDVRILFQKCRLVHADLSEYNLLYMDGKAWMIDVSQAVEHESPQALEYLRTDCHNVNVFFRKQGVSTLTLREFFEYVVDTTLPALEDPDSKRYLEHLVDDAIARGIDETLEKEDDAFRFVHIPRNLSVSYPFVRDFLKIQRGLLSPSDVYYAAVAGLKPDLSGAQEIHHSEQNCENNTSGEESSTSSDLDETKSLEEAKRIKNKSIYIRPRNESPNSRKERKKAVKKEQAENRKNKIPKHVKRRRLKK